MYTMTRKRFFPSLPQATLTVIAINYCVPRLKGLVEPENWKPVLMVLQEGSCLGQACFWHCGEQ